MRTCQPQSYHASHLLPKEAVLGIFCPISIQVVRNSQQAANVEFSLSCIWRSLSVSFILQAIFYICYTLPYHLKWNNRLAIVLLHPTFMCVDDCGNKGNIFERRTARTDSNCRQADICNYQHIYRASRCLTFWLPSCMQMEDTGSMTARPVRTASCRYSVGASIIDKRVAAVEWNKTNMRADERWRSRVWG